MSILDREFFRVGSIVVRFKALPQFGSTGRRPFRRRAPILGSAASSGETSAAPRIRWYPPAFAAVGLSYRRTRLRSNTLKSPRRKSPSAPPDDVRLRVRKWRARVDASAADSCVPRSNPNLMTDAGNEASRRFVSLLRDGEPSPTVRALSAALALASQGRFDELFDLYRAALECDVAPHALVEGALSAHLFAGFPRAIEAFETLTRAGIERAAVPEIRSAAHVHADGLVLFRRIYGSNADAVLAQLRRYGNAFHDAVLEDAYGRILSRPGIDGRTRETMAVCALAALGLSRQLFSHLRGAVAFGATLDECAAMLDLAATISPATADAARHTFARAFRLDSQQGRKP